MARKTTDSKETGAKTLNLIFAGAILLVAGAIIAVTVYCIDSVQKNFAAVHNIKSKEISRTLLPAPEGAITKVLNQQVKIVEKRHLNQAELSRSLEGSELVFMQGLKAEDQGNFQTGVRLFSQILAMVPEEAKTKKTWVAAGCNPGDRNLYTAFTYQQRSFCRIQLKQYQQAIDDLSQAIKLRPDYGLNYQNRSIAYRMIGQRALADADLKIARKIAQEERLKNGE